MNNSNLKENTWYHKILDEDWKNAKFLIDQNFPDYYTGFGYGSGIIPQKDYDYLNFEKKDKPQLDFVFVVENVEEWLEKAYEMNPNHFTGLSSVYGAKYPNWLLKKIFPVIFFPNCRISDDYDPNNSIDIKYGVVSKKTFENDLDNWNLFTLAGRCQKPIRLLKKPDFDFENDLQKLLDSNLTYAINTALVLNAHENPKTTNYISFENLLQKIIGLSYQGDLREYFKAESSDKKEKILQGSRQQIIELYKDKIYLQMVKHVKFCI